MNKTIFTSLFLLSALMIGCSSDTKKQTDKETAKANAVMTTNQYILTSTDNKQFIVTKENGGFLLENAEGKVVIFDIFATWCPPCKASATHLTSLQEKFKDDLIIIGITIEDGISNDKLLQFKKENNAAYSIVNSKDNRPLVNEIADALELGDRFPIPIMALYKDGKLLNHYVGEVQEEFVASDIKVALGK
ncbi:TlpA family protein disulfide reductase [Sulfurimonas sp. SAG-AH-194-I05]|nr:TlpA family protein disulfide reductase [Sulfurimonas sp. SAG-AH-194-I05]